MNMTIWRLLRAMTRVEGGHWCRCCHQAIRAGDPFGMSEGVCSPCRSEVEL